MTGGAVRKGGVSAFRRPRAASRGLARSAAGDHARPARVELDLGHFASQRAPKAGDGIAVLEKRET